MWIKKICTNIANLWDLLPGSGRPAQIYVFSSAAVTTGHNYSLCEIDVPSSPDRLRGRQRGGNIWERRRRWLFREAASTSASTPIEFRQHYFMVVLSGPAVTERLWQLFVAQASPFPSFLVDIFHLRNVCFRTTPEKCNYIYIYSSCFLSIQHALGAFIVF